MSDKGSWTASFGHVFVADRGPAARVRPQLEAHLAAVADRSAAEPQPPALEFESEDEALACRTAWLAYLRRGELLSALGEGEREAEISVVELHAGDVALVGEGGEPLAIIAEREAILANQALLDALVGRTLIVVGDAGELWSLSRALDDRQVKLSFARALVDRLPLLPAAARLLGECYGCPVGEALADPGGGWVAITARHGGLLVQVRPREQLYAAGRTGERVEAGRWGVLGTECEGERRLLGVWGRLQRSREDEPGIEVGVPETPLESRGELDLNIQDLHNLLGTLPVFAYQLCLRDDGSRLLISTVPGVDPEQAEAEIREAIARGLDNLPIELREPGIEFPGMRADDQRIADLQRVVQVSWAGPEGSAARRGAWRAALVAAGVTRAGTARLVDVETGVAFDDPLALEVLAELNRGDRRPPASPLEVPRERTVAVGLPPTGEGAGEGVVAQGWIARLAADEARDGMFIAGHEPTAVAAIVGLFESGATAPGLERLILNGVHMQPFTRPTLACGRERDDDDRPFYVDLERCTGAGDCARICPTDAITLVEQRPQIDVDACIRCHLCNERCDSLALRPFLDSDAFVDGRTMVRDAAGLARIRDRVRPRALEGKLVEPPAALDERAGPSKPAPAAIRRKPTVVLGLATVTLMEHAAALMIDGELVAAIEEERLARVRHYTFQHPERPGTSLSSDTCLRLEEAWPPRAIDAVLATAGLTMDEVDLVAINGIPARLRHSFAGGGGWRPPPVLRGNSVAFVPHHMTHAASVYGLSGFDEAWILSIDGRGDYETATVWRAEGHELEVVDAVPWLPDRSFGGVYETVTRVLGFGTHGQGSTMALAALGEPTVDFSDCLGIDDDGTPVLSEWAAEKRFASYQRGYDGELTQAHKDLAASAQRALETTVGDYLAHHAGSLRGQNLGICGGVALNCRMNGILRERFEPARMHVPPGANDAGTAIGAAIIGHRELTGELPRLDLGHTHLGPAWSDEAIARSLERMRVPFQRLREVGEQAAALLADGKILCWFQGPMEFGPRALGGRSIIADPRREDLKARLNAMKSRQSWRPFGPSVLAGRQSDWFVHDWDSRFMLFAVDVKPDKREQIPVVVHFDGSSRPQVVHREHHPRYHDLISAFERRTGVPMIVNTSFNRGGEPIVCNPAEALRSFAGLGADAIVLGDCLVRRELLRRR